MLASELVLLLFISGWIWGQYEQQETRMDKDLQLTFDKTYEKLSNNLIDIAVDSLLRSTKSNHQSVSFEVDMKKTVRMRDSFPTNIHIEHIPGNTTNTVFVAAPFVKQTAMGGKDTFTVQRLEHSMSKNDTGPRLPEIKQMLRVVLNQSLNDIAQKTRVDSTILKKEFLNTAHSSYKGLEARWIKDSLLHKFNYKVANDNDAIHVDGYKQYLFVAILPQIGFTVFILGLTGIAFGMAYRNMKRQLKFAAQKDNFISNISHELKTPVATTKVALEALSTYHAIDDPERTKRYLKVAMFEMERLAALISRVLNTLQTEDGLLQLETEAINLSGLIREVSETLSPLLLERKITFTAGAIPGEIAVKADRVHLTGVFYNLIDNAIKYGAGTVKISVEDKGDRVTVNIMNNGNPIDTEYQDKVFEKFFRVPQGNEHTVKGHGLGLSYAQYVVKAHGGNISLESHKDETIFSVTLPKS